MKILRKIQQCNTPTFPLMESLTMLEAAVEPPTMSWYLPSLTTSLLKETLRLCSVVSLVVLS